MRVMLLLLTACLHRPPNSPRGAPSAGGSYTIAVAAASGQRTVTAIYRLQVAAAGLGRVRIHTIHTSGSWEVDDQAIAYDSDQPRASDPWPLRLQHAVAAVPALIELDSLGAPSKMVDAGAWRQAAHAALDAVDLPARARATGLNLVDPEGLISDLARNFPGRPSDTWVRHETIAGLPATRTERCSHSIRGGSVHWECSGTIDGPHKGNARLYETSSSTQVQTDRAGLVSMESTYSGTLVILDPSGTQVLDRPIAGKRLVQRQ